jgi:DNA-binding LacI/PurR family transcriptional regulator
MKSDMTAIGAMSKSYADDVVIPHDLSLVGFDDLRLAQFMLPPLTTVQMSQAELARLALEAFLADVDRQDPMSNRTE